MSTQSDRDLHACVLAALILHDSGVAITGDKIKTILDATNNADVQLVYCNIVAKFLQGKDVTELATRMQTGQQAQGGRDGEWEIVSDAGSSDGDHDVILCYSDDDEGASFAGLFD